MAKCLRFKHLPDPNAQQNNNPIYRGSPTLVKTVQNGKLYTVGNGEDSFYIAHIWGSPYDMGKAHGQLLGIRAVNMMNKVWEYLEEQIVQAINGTVNIFKPWFLKDVANMGYFLEEAKGVADGSGADLKKILRIHMIGELTLELLIGAMMVTVYHPTNGHAFANFGWTGWIGSITGVSSTRLAISEIGVSFPDETFGQESRFGTPFTVRTLDNYSNIFRGIEYSASVSNFFDDKNIRPNAEWHPKIEDVVYWGMDWNCPAFNEVLAKQLNYHYGNITAENVIRDVVPIVQSGNLQVAIYDLTQNIAYLSNARGSNETGPKYAYE
ncbi:hypothetical protein KUTeg_006348, partial [Tegillarca granosa]